MYPPSPSNLSEDIPKLRRIASNCAPSLVLTTRLYLSRVVRPSSLLLHSWPAVRGGWRTTDDLPVRSSGPMTVQLPLTETLLVGINPGGMATIGWPPSNGGQSPCDLCAQLLCRCPETLSQAPQHTLLSGRKRRHRSCVSFYWRMMGPMRAPLQGMQEWRGMCGGSKRTGASACQFMHLIRHTSDNSHPCGTRSRRLPPSLSL